MLDTQLDKKETHEGDVIELLVDLPKYNLKQGQRGVVMTKFEEPAEAYDIELEDEEGDFLGFAYSVKPHQFANLSWEAYDQGMIYLAEGNLVAAERKLQQAVDFNPRYKDKILNGILSIFTKDAKNLGVVILCLRMLLRIDPEDQYARDNLAIAYMKCGIQEVSKDNSIGAIEFFHMAIGLDATPSIISLIKENFAVVFTNLGIVERHNGNYEQELQCMRLACVCFPDERTRLNLGIAYAHLAQFHMRNTDYQKALPLIQYAEETGLPLPELLNDYGVALVFEGHLDEAVNVFERALRLAPEDKAIKENLARLKNNEVKESFVVQDFNRDFIYIPAAAQGFQQVA